MVENTLKKDSINLESEKSDNSINIIGRIITEGYDDFQRVRIASTNRIRDIVRKTIEEIGFNEVEDKKEKKDYTKKYTDTKLFQKLDIIHAQKKINDKEYNYMIRCKEIMGDSRALERKYKNAMLDFISGEVIYNEFLSKIKGFGPILSANLIKEFNDCSQYDTVSKLWAHCGQSVIDGIAPKRRKGENISYNPKLRTLTWKVSDSLLKQNKGYYRQIYDTEKEKQRNKTYAEGYLEMKYGKPYKSVDINLTKLHAHNRALRKMRKIFLDHYWHASRELNGLPAEKNYVEGILLHNHIVTWKEIVRREEIQREKEKEEREKKKEEKKQKSKT